jgi:hypothetical protein
MPPRGLYETLISEALDAQLNSLGESLSPHHPALHEAEAADRIALHLHRVLERAIASLDKAQRVAVGTALARHLIDVIVEATQANALASERPVAPALVLKAVLSKLPDGRAETIPQPLIPLLDTALLTNAPGEPRVGHQVLTEIHSADRIDLVMAFIRRSGIAPMLDALRAHCQAGRALRVLTTPDHPFLAPRKAGPVLEDGSQVEQRLLESGMRPIRFHLLSVPALPLLACARGKTPPSASPSAGAGGWVQGLRLRPAGALPLSGGPRPMPSFAPGASEARPRTANGMGPVLPSVMRNGKPCSLPFRGSRAERG